MKENFKNITIALVMSMLSVASASAIDNVYTMEIGAQAGVNYYIGDANRHIFMHPREVAGLQLRYKFDRRWCLAGRAQWSRFGFMNINQSYTTPTITPGTNPGTVDPGTGGGTTPTPDPGTGGGTIDPGTGGGGGFPGGRPGRGMPQRAPEKPWGDDGDLSTRPCVSADIVAEFNFFEYGNDWEVGRIKPYTPYIFLGVGVGWYGLDWSHERTLGIPASLYIPFGIGFKWKFAPRWGMNIAWQHNLYLKDNVEGKPGLNNVHEINGSNILENDLMGQLSLGIVFDFAKKKRACKTCMFIN